MPPRAKRRTPQWGSTSRGGRIFHRLSFRGNQECQRTAIACCRGAARCAGANQDDQARGGRRADVAVGRQRARSLSGKRDPRAERGSRCLSRCAAPLYLIGKCRAASGQRKSASRTRTGRGNVVAAAQGRAVGADILAFCESETKLEMVPKLALDSLVRRTSWADAGAANPSVPAAASDRAAALQNVRTP